LGENPENENSLYLLLVNTDTKGAKFVYDRMEKANFKVEEVAL
jgi:hypothetical protein